jgi:hypothetical protein
LSVVVVDVVVVVVVDDVVVVVVVGAGNWRSQTLFATTRGMCSLPLASSQQAIASACEPHA